MPAPRSSHPTRIEVQAEYAPDPERQVAALLVLLGHAPTSYAVINATPTLRATDSTGLAPAARSRATRRSKAE
jgi:hypothetical protein